MIQDQPEIIELIFNTASEKWNSYKTSKEESDHILNHFIIILDHLYTFNKHPELFNQHQELRNEGEILANEQIYISFVCKLLEKINSENFRDRDSFTFVLQTLRGDQIEELTRAILNRVEDSWDILFILLSKVLNNENNEKVLKILLPTLQDPRQLQMLYETWNLTKIVREQLSLEQIRILFQPCLDEEAFLRKISVFLNSRTEIVVDLLNENSWINIEKLMEANRQSTFEGKKPIQPYLCGIYALRYLNGEGSFEEKMAKVHAAINFTDPLKDEGWKDERVIFSSFLASRCSSAQLPTILLSLKSYNGIRQRMAESFLATILNSKDVERIQQAFTAYWTCFEELNCYLPYCEWVILPKIKTEEVLRAVYQSIPQELSQEKKNEINKLLLEGAHYNNFGYREHYKVDLPQDIVNRVIQEEMPN